MTPQPVTVRVGTLADVRDDGTLMVSFARALAVEAVPVGAIPPLWSQVVCLSTYDRVFVLGADIRTTTLPEPDPPVVASKRYDSGLTTDRDGHLWAPLVVSGSWVGEVGASHEVRIDFPHPIRTDVDPLEWAVLAQMGAASGHDGTVIVEARDRANDHMVVECPDVHPNQRVRINWIVSVPQQGDL